MGDTSDVELGIGLGDVKNGKTRMEGLDGLNDQINWNREYMSHRLLHGFFGFLIIIPAWVWIFDMPVELKYGLVGISVAFFGIYFFLKIRHSINVKTTRDRQLEAYRKSKKA